MIIEPLEQRADIWRGGRSPYTGETVSTGFPALDQALPGGGWPLGSLTEILVAAEGMGAAWLTLPALARLSRSERWLTWVAPPYIPYAPALSGMGIDLSRVLMVHPRAGTDVLWAVEQALRSGTCSAVLSWLTDLDTRTLRRLLLAAEHGQTLGLLFRPERFTRQHSTAALRLQVTPAPHGIRVTVLKCRGRVPAQPIELRFKEAPGPRAH